MDVRLPSFEFERYDVNLLRADYFSIYKAIDELFYCIAAKAKAFQSKLENYFQASLF